MISLIRNRDIKRWEKRSKWVLVYGRRKTGKSFFVRNFTKWDKYFFVGKAGEIFEENDKISYEAFVRAVFDSLENNKTVVVDEIQRLPEEFYDMLHNKGVKGSLIAVSSTLWLAKNLIGKKSPLLGLFSEFRMDIINEIDVIKNLSGHIKDARQLAEFSTYMREPWLVPLWESAGNFLLPMALNTRLTIPALIGEIFSEEERELSAVYEGILRAVADGKRISGEIADYLYSAKIIPVQNPSLVHPYLSVMHSMGLLEKLKVFGKNRFFYYHASPVVDLFYYMSAKYGFSETDLPEKQIEKILAEKLPHHIEQFFRNLLSDHFGLRKEIISEKDYEIDIVLCDFKKIKIVGEVKWKEKVTKDEIKKIESVLGKFDCKKILVVPDKKNLEMKPEGIEVWDVNTILKMVL